MWSAECGVRNEKIPALFNSAFRNPHSAFESVLARRRVETRLRGLAARLLGTAGIALGRTACADRRTRFLARHDVLDLRGIERLPLEQGLRHLLHLVAVFLDDGAGAGILLVHDA